MKYDVGSEMIGNVNMQRANQIIVHKGKLFLILLFRIISIRYKAIKHWL